MEGNLPYFWPLFIKPGDEYISGLFRSCGFEWSLKAIRVNDDIFFHLKLNSPSSSEEEVKVAPKFYVLNVVGAVIARFIPKELIEFTPNEYRFLWKIPYKPVHDTDMGTVMKVYCLIEPAVPANQIPDVVKNNLWKLFEEKRLTDVRLIVGGKPIEAHKVILAAASTVFMNMFEQDPHLREITISDFDYETILAMVNFMYTAKVDALSPELASKLVDAAEKYEKQELQDLCKTFLSHF